MSAPAPLQTAQSPTSSNGLWEPPQSPTSPTAQNGRHGSLASLSAAAGAPGAQTRKMKYAGKRIAQIVRLKKEYVKEYKACHAKVWPEVLAQIRACNIEDYSIFHDEESGMLFASFKYVGYNWEGDMEKMRDNPKVREWWKMTDGYQESLVPGAVSSEAGNPPWWKGIEQVFYYA